VRRLEGKVALITGAARGQGRSHAVRLAQEGASIVAVDSCGGKTAYPWLTYPMATESDLYETVRQVRVEGGEILSMRADVRDVDSICVAAAEAVRCFGGLDIVSANAGIGPRSRVSWLKDDHEWDDVYQVNLWGVRNTCKAAIPAMIEAGRGGAITITSSVAGLRGAYGMSDYCAAKTGLIGFATSLAQELGPFGIRVNVIAPGTVDTDMIQNPGLRKLFRPDLKAPTREDVAQVCQEGSILGVPWVDPVDISNALVFLSSEEARYITAVVLPVDAGASAR